MICVEIRITWVYTPRATPCTLQQCSLQRSHVFQRIRVSLSVLLYETAFFSRSVRVADPPPCPCVIVSDITSTTNEKKRKKSVRVGHWNNTLVCVRFDRCPRRVIRLLFISALTTTGRYPRVYRDDTADVKNATRTMFHRVVAKKKKKNRPVTGDRPPPVWSVRLYWQVHRPISSVILCAHTCINDITVGTRPQRRVNPV